MTEIRIPNSGPIYPIVASEGACWEFVGTSSLPANTFPNQASPSIDTGEAGAGAEGDGTVGFFPFDDLPPCLVFVTPVVPTVPVIPPNVVVESSPSPSPDQNTVVPNVVVESSPSPSPSPDQNIVVPNVVIESSPSPNLTPVNIIAESSPSPNITWSLSIPDSWVASTSVVDMPMFIPLGKIAKGVRNQIGVNGENIRFSATNGGVFLPTEVTSNFDLTTTSGGFWIKHPLGKTSGNVIYIDIVPGASAGLTPTDVWTNYNYMLHGDTDGTDSTANGNNGTLTGDIDNNDDGQIGKAFGENIDATGDVVNLGQDASLSVGAVGEDYSIGCWLKRTGTWASGGYWVMTAGNNSGDGKQPYSMVVRNVSGTYTARAYIYDGTNISIGDNTTIIDPDTWYQVIFVRDATNDEVRTYVNGSSGTPVTDATTVTCENTLRNTALFGRHEGGTTYGNGFLGYVDEAFLKAGALTDDEVTFLFNSQNSPNDLSWIG